jgi:hypothetical protein
MESTTMILIEFQNEFRHAHAAYSRNLTIDIALASLLAGEHRGFAWGGTVVLLVAKLVWFAFCLDRMELPLRKIGDETLAFAGIA